MIFGEMLLNKSQDDAGSLSDNQSISKYIMKEGKRVCCLWNSHLSLAFKYLC